MIRVSIFIHRLESSRVGISFILVNDGASNKIFQDKRKNRYDPSWTLESSFPSFLGHDFPCKFGSMEVGRNVYTLTLIRLLCNFCPYGNWHWSLWERRFHWCNYVQVRPRSRHLLRGNGELEPSSQWASLFYVTLAPNNATLFTF